MLLSVSTQSVRSLPPKQMAEPLAQSSPAATSTQKGQKLPLSASLAIGKQTILLEVARTAQEQATGLMYRTELAKDRGMLFVFDPPRPAQFWMKNTLIPLDMIFVSNGVVKYIGNNIPPCKIANCPSYGPDQSVAVDGVIELRGGRAAELKLKVGDTLKITDTQPKGVILDRVKK
jgi:uncharacterized protein